METKGLLFGSIGLERARHVFLKVGIIDLLMSSAAWRGWSILRGDASNNAPLSKRDSGEVARDEYSLHPGEVLLEDFMKPLGLTQYRLAQDIGVTPIRISQIVNGERSISVDTAMRLARYFGTSAAVWLRLQVRYDLEVAESELSERINREVKVRPQPHNRL